MVQIKAMPIFQGELMAAFNQSVCIIIAVIKLFIAIKCFGSWVSCYVNMAMAASNHEKYENNPFYIYYTILTGKKDMVLHVVLVVLVDTNDTGGSLCRFPECSSYDPGSGDVPHPSGDCVCPHHTTGCQSLHVQLPADPHRPVPTPVRERSADHHHPHTCQSGRKLAGKKNGRIVSRH